MASKKGIQNIHGKDYKTVGLRVAEFRAVHPDWQIINTIVERNESCVVMMTEIKNEKGFVIATGFAEEFRNASRINKTSALENCETSAVGRALAFLDGKYQGEDFQIASADEVVNAIQSQEDSKLYKIPDNPNKLKSYRLQVAEQNFGIVSENAVKQWNIAFIGTFGQTGIKEIKPDWLKYIHNMEDDELSSKNLLQAQFDLDVKFLFRKEKDWCLVLLEICKILAEYHQVWKFDDKISYIKINHDVKQLFKIEKHDLLKILEKEQDKVKEIEKGGK